MHKNLVDIQQATKKDVQLFLQTKLPSTFRYFQTRNLSILDNHILTCSGKIEGKIVAYAHLDQDQHLIWFGVCVLPEYQKQGIGSKILHYIFTFCRNHRIQEIHLSVDKTNLVAKHLYQKFGFVQYDQKSQTIQMKKKF